MSLIPLGRECGVFARCELAAAAEQLLAWGREVGRFQTAKHLYVPLQEAWKLVDHRITPRDRAILIGVGSEWTGFFDNDRLGYISSSIPSNLTRLLGCETYGFSDHGERGIGFRAILPGSDTPAKRRVTVYKEDGWKFEEAGEPLQFENLDAYKRRRVNERLTQEILRAYGAALGIPFWDEEAYGRDVIFLDERGAPRLDEATISRKLGEIAASLGGKLIRLRANDKNV